MNVVFLCGGYYPNYSATGNCVREIVKVFSKNINCNINVVCKSDLGHDSFEQDEYSNIYRIANVRLKMDKLIMNNKQKNSIFGFFHKSFWAIYRLFQLDGLDDSLVNKYVKTLYLINKKEPIDVLLPCCMPAETLKATLFFAKNKKIFIFPLLYDLYSNNINFFRYKWNYCLKRSIAKKIEDELFLQSNKIYYIDNWDSYFSKNHYANSERVEHPLIVKREKNHKLSDIDKNKINMVYQGEVNVQMRPVDKVLKILSVLINDMTDISIHFFSYGNMSNMISDFSQQYQQNVKYYGKVDKNIAEQYFDNCDIALIFANKDPAIVPSKIYECIASGYPIIYFYYSDSEKAYEILEKYPLVFFISQNKYSIETIKLLEKWIKEQYKNNVMFPIVLKLFSNATPDYVVNDIKKQLE